ncbi:hypothetical protein [Candidatus Neptunochlamydia vexilliferae]|nr:hypothetical protein [Candidatus Neptunochlamydia vexilliferae]
MNDYFALVSDTLAYIQEKLPREHRHIISDGRVLSMRGLQGARWKEPQSGLLKQGNNGDFHRKGQDSRENLTTLSKLPPKVELPPPPKEVVAPPPTPEVKQPPPPPKKKAFELKPQPKPSSESLSGTLKILKEVAPDLYVHDTVPPDHKAKRVKEAWKEKQETPTFPILFQGAPYRSFVTNIAKAIDLTYGTCRIVEVEPQKKWDLFLESENLKLILAPDALIFGNKELLSFYQETPQQKVRTLGKVPLLLLPDLSLYYKDPYLKRALWNVICNTIGKLPNI